MLFIFIHALMLNSKVIQFSEAPTTRTKAKSACDLSFTKYPDASCILYDKDHCDASEGLIELTNGGMIDSIEERSGFDIESFSVREGCKLTMYKGLFDIFLVLFL